MNRALEIALGEYGVKEIAGKKHNPDILKYSKELGMKFDWVTSDEVAWCSIFVNWAGKKAGFKISNSAAARSWLKVGNETKNPELGDIVVFKRGNSGWQGHVGFFIRATDGYIYLLGGNQSNSVCISKYSKKDLLGYRQLQY